MKRNLGSKATDKEKLIVSAHRKGRKKKNSWKKAKSKEKKTKIKVAVES